MVIEYRYAAAAAVGSVSAVVAPYGSWQTIYTDARQRIREQIAPGAFRRIMNLVASGAREIRLFAAHQPERVLASTRTGTLRLTDTQAGLRFDADLPDTTDGRDLLTLIGQGLIGSSIGFDAAASTIERNGGDAVMKDIDLAEISLTANPAYSGTTVRPAAQSVAPPLPQPQPVDWGWLQAAGV